MTTSLPNNTQPNKPTALKKAYSIWLPNLLLVGGVLLLTQLNLLLFAAGLLLISKWQIFRGGRKLWMRNLRDNSCDLVVATSALVLLMLIAEDLLLSIGIAALYYLWLVAVKPRIGHIAVAAQAAACQFSGLLVLFLVARRLPAILIVGLAWLIGVIAADHLLSAHHERAHGVIAFSWGIIVAQASWLFWHWLIIYSLADNRFLIPQGPIVISLLGYIFGSMYLDHAQAKLRRSRLVEYITLLVGLVVAIIIGTQWDVRL